MPFTVCPSRLEMLPTPLSLLHEMAKKLWGCNMKKKCSFKRRKSFSYQEFKKQKTRGFFFDIKRWSGTANILWDRLYIHVCSSAKVKKWWFLLCWISWKMREMKPQKSGNADSICIAQHSCTIVKESEKKYYLFIHPTCVIITRCWILTSLNISCSQTLIYLLLTSVS